MAEEHETTREEVDASPIDVKLISTITDRALALRLNTSTRDEIMGFVDVLHGSLSLLVGEELAADSDMVALAQIHKAKGFLKTRSKPTDVTPPFRAYAWTREAASLTRRLLWIWSEKNGVEHP
ncbi:hypothetical protein ABT115_08920 [Streptomyces sp. NPDC001832]|uniref:hypothetical protein n=1 Tax=Streptomyces sp. NPDC001832 TaxID=3154527 RepID=UPI00331800D2